MGFDPDGYVNCITSGEMTFEGLRDRSAAPYNEIVGKRWVVVMVMDACLSWILPIGLTFCGGLDISMYI